MGQDETALKGADDVPDDADDAELPLPPGDRAWPRTWQGPFLTALSVLPDVSAACRLARIGRATVYRHRDSDAAFRDAWDEALELARDTIQRIAHQWVTTGVPVRTKRSKSVVKVNAAGETVETTTETVETEGSERSATLMIFWLKAWYPDRYRWADRLEHGGAEGGPIRIESLDALDAQIEKLHAELAVASPGDRDEPEPE